MKTYFSDLACSYQLMNFYLANSYQIWQFKSKMGSGKCPPYFINICLIGRNQFNTRKSLYHLCCHARVHRHIKTADRARDSWNSARKSNGPVRPKFAVLIFLRNWFIAVLHFIYILWGIWKMNEKMMTVEFLLVGPVWSGLPLFGVVAGSFRDSRRAARGSGSQLASQNSLLLPWNTIFITAICVILIDLISLSLE